MMTEKRFAIIVDCNNVTRLIDRENKLISMHFGFDLDDLTDYERSKVQEWLDLLNEQQATITALKEENDILKQKLRKNYIANKQQELIEELQEENKQLKLTLSEYGVDLKAFEIFKQKIGYYDKVIDDE